MTNITFLDKDYQIDRSLIRMELTANRLLFLLKHTGLSRAELARKLGWKKSRVTKVLSGDVNLTLKTIDEIAEALGYEFETIFYNDNYPKPKQPWQIDRENKVVNCNSSPNTIRHVFEVQSADDVFNDFMKGEEANQYIKVMPSATHSEMITKVTQPILSNSTNEYVLPKIKTHIIGN